MSALQATLAGRREAEKLMVSTCKIERATGETVLDPITYEEVPVVITAYEGKCKIRMANAMVKRAQIPGQVLAVQQLVLSVPIVGSETIRSGDVVTVTANPLDDGLVDKKFTVRGQHAQTFATARRFEIEGIS